MQLQGAKLTVGSGVKQLAPPLMLWPLSVYTSVQRSFFAVEDEDEDEDEDYPGDDD